MKLGEFLPRKQSLALKFLYLLIAYITLLVVFPLLSFNAKFGIGWDALLQSPAGSHVDSVADAINEQLRTSPSASWNGILKNFGGIYQVKYYLFDGNGEQLTGDPINLPPTLAQKIRMMPPFQKHKLPPPGAPFRDPPPNWLPPNRQHEREPGPKPGPDSEFQMRPEFGPD